MLDSDINIASYVINLDRAKDRLVHVRQQFDRIDVGFTRVSAIDAREFSSEQVAYFRDLYCSENGFQSEWSLGYIALFLSHRKTWEMIAKGETAWAAVFEDDVHLSSSLPLFLKSSGLFPNVADIIRIETTLQSMRLSPRPVAQMHGTRLFRVHDGAWGSAGYIIHKDIAQWLSVAPPRFHNSLDWMLFHKSCAVGRALTVFQVDPAPCVQDQCHPDKNARKYFSMETSSKKNRFVNFAREAFGPAARLLRRRRRVSFKIGSLVPIANLADLCNRLWEMTSIPAPELLGDMDCWTSAGQKMVRFVQQYLVSVCLNRIDKETLVAVKFSDVFWPGRNELNTCACVLNLVCLYLNTYCVIFVANGSDMLPISGIKNAARIRHKAGVNLSHWQFR